MSDELNQAAEAIMDPLGHTRRVPFPRRGFTAVVHPLTVASHPQVAPHIDELILRLIQNANAIGAALAAQDEDDDGAWFKGLLGTALRIPAVSGPIAAIAAKHVTWDRMRPDEIEAAGDTYQATEKAPEV